MTWQFPKIRMIEEGQPAVCIVCGHVAPLCTRVESALCVHGYTSMSIQCIDGTHLECDDEYSSTFTEHCCVCNCHEVRGTKEDAIVALTKIEQELRNERG